MIIRVIKVFVMFSKEVIPSPDIVLRQLKIAYDTQSRSQVSHPGRILLLIDRVDLKVRSRPGPSIMEMIIRFYAGKLQATEHLFKLTSYLLNIDFVAINILTRPNPS